MINFTMININTKFNKALEIFAYNHSFEKPTSDLITNMLEDYSFDQCPCPSLSTSLLQRKPKAETSPHFFWLLLDVSLQPLLSE